MTPTTVTDDDTLRGRFKRWRLAAPCDEAIALARSLRVDALLADPSPQRADAVLAQQEDSRHRRPVL